MPGAEAGFKTAAMTMMTGFMVSAILGALEMYELRSLFNILSVFGIIATFENTNYWGIMYTIGHFLGIALVGRYFLATWEILVMVAIFIFYIVLKISRKF